MTTPTDELPPFETRLLAELTDVVEDRRRAATAAPTRAPSRRPRLVAATAGVAAVAIAVAIAPGLTRDSGSSAFAVRELSDGVIEVRMDTDLRDGRALEAELREFGVDVSVVTVPSSPSAVGAIHSLEAPEQDAEPGFVWGPDGGEIAFTIDPSTFGGQLTLHVNVEPGPGESYEVAEEVFEPGEVLGGLHCQLGEPLRATQLVPYLDQLGLDAVWQTIGPDPDGDPASAISAEVEAAPDGQVMWGYAVDADTVQLEVMLDDAELDPAHWQPRLSDVPCTPEQAAAWN